MTDERRGMRDGEELLPRAALEVWRVPEMPEDMKERVMNRIDETWRVGMTSHHGASSEKNRASTIALLTAVAAAAASAAAVLLAVRPEVVPTVPNADAVVVSQAAPAPRGHLTLEVDPPDAIVELDGVALQGPSPFVATELSVGPHELRVHRAGRVAWTRVVHVPGSQLHLPIKLLPEADPTATSEPDREAVPEATVKTSTVREPTPRGRTAEQPNAPASASPVDCILAPDLPQCQKEERGAPTGHPNLREMLTQAEIKAGVDAVLPKARACGSEHGAPSGEVVRVRISIAGATGEVSSSIAQSPHVGTPLGRCVAAALEQAVFPKFRRPAMGAVYPIRL